MTEKEKKEDMEKITRVNVPMAKAFRYELKKRAAIRNVSMQSYIEMACIDFMKIEDSYNQ